MTDTTREGFEKWAAQRLMNFRTDTNMRYLAPETAASWTAWQAAKADELAFLEGLIPILPNSRYYITGSIKARIAELKGEK